ncbi:MAG: hypothetical protein QOH47_2415 [Sphingomonadales bacterium]|jgi:hypothetical protein|nr:hypothetical protein [Sphingomonadales bacterium]
MAVPASTDELEEFTPPSLKNAPVPPVFLLRPANGRELRKFEYRLMAEGLQFYSTEAFRAEMLKGLAALWSVDDYPANAARLVSYWTLCDQKGEPDVVEAEFVAELTRRLMRAWPPLSAMAADNQRFSDESGRIAASMFVVGWTGLETAYLRESGSVPLLRIDDVETELAGMEKKAGEAKVEGVGKPGTAFAEVASAAYLRLLLTETERKNSVSPPPSTPALNGSTLTPSKPTAAAKSKTSASSKSKRARLSKSSRTPSATA